MRNDEFRANDSDQHRKNVAPYWDVSFRFRMPGVERLPDTLSFLAQGPSDQTVGEDEEGAAEGANVPGGSPDALVDDSDAEESEAEAAGIAQDANREVCGKSGHFARGDLADLALKKLCCAARLSGFCPNGSWMSNL